jgi:hypothetical protein
MRVFICSYSWFSLAIPMDFVSSIFLHSDNLNNKIQFDAENCNTYVSLPMLFDCPDVNVKHGIILKNGDNGNDSMENKVILLSTEVESEKDIPAENIYPLPRIIGVTRFSHIFNGIFFYTGHCDSLDKKITRDIVLLLNPRQLVQNIQKELIS